MVYIYGGIKFIGFEVFVWVKQVVFLGLGEFLVILMDKDGIQNGYDIVFYKELMVVVDVLVIVFGGVGKIDDFVDVFLNLGVIGVLVVFVFYFQQLMIVQVKEDLIKKGVLVWWNQIL